MLYINVFSFLVRPHFEEADDASIGPIRHTSGKEKAI